MARRRLQRVGVHIEGLEEVIQMINNMEDTSLEFVDKASEAGTKVALNHAKRTCPTRTGKMKAALQIAKEKKRRKTLCYHRIKAPRIRYMFYVEVGTSKMAAKPFLRPAVDRNIKQINNVTVNKMLEGIDRVI